MDTQNELAPNVPVQQILPDEAKSVIGGFELPTGYIDEAGNLHKQIVVTEITGEEEDVLASKKMPVHQRMETILQRCIKSIGTIQREGNPNWSKVIRDLHVTDRLYAIIKIRTVSIGAPYRFKTACMVCNEHFDQVVSLDQFHISGLRDPMERNWKGTLPRSGKSYVAKVQTGAEEAKLASISKSEDMLSLAIVARLVELDGQQPVTLQTVKKLSLADREHLRTDFKTHEGDVDNKVDVECEKCGAGFKTEIDIATPSFFFPSVT